MIKYEKLKAILQKNKCIPYPKIPKMYSNPRYCKFIYESFGGGKGELTAITQYIYEHMELSEHKDISRILQDIAIEEMHHLDILGQILLELGEKTIYRNSRGEMWSAHNVKYKMCDLKEIMKINMKSEEEAIEGYRLLMRYTNNMYLRKVYERIILDEKTHLEIFKEILFNLNEKENCK